MPIPLLQFQPYNPMDTLIKTAMGTYGGLGEAKGQQLTNQMNQAKMPYMQQNMEQALLASQLANQKSQIQQPYWQQQTEADLINAQMQPEIEQSLIDYRRNQQNRNGAVKTGIPGMQYARDQAIAEGRTKDAQDLERAIELELKGKAASQFRSAPPDIKRSMVAQATAYTGDQSKALDLLQQGKNLEEIAEMSGISPEQAENIPGVYSPTQPNITAAINRKVAATELEYLQPKVNEGIGDYISKMPINGYSPEQAVDLALGMNKEKQIKFMAAQMLMPELIVLRLRQVGSEMSHAQFSELEQKTIGVKKAFEVGMTPEIYKEANNLANEWLAGAAKVANNEMFSTGRPSKVKNEEEMVNSVSGAMNNNRAPLSSLSDEDFMKQYNEIMGGQ